jgi:hypothetical protein
MRGLEQFLRVITAHEHIVRDLELRNFLTSADYKSREVPYSNKLMNFIGSLPSLSQITIDKDTLNAYGLLLSSGARLDVNEEETIKLSINLQEVNDSL